MLGAKWAEVVRQPLLTDSICKAEGQIVSGPFKGLVLPKQQPWGDGDLFAKLHGCYESEVLTVLQSLAGIDFDAAINIGCADGYYAVGLARLFNVKTSHAIDIDPLALASCKELSIANDCADQVECLLADGEDNLFNLVSQKKRFIVVADCEGAEIDLFSTRVLDALKRSHIIVECHDAQVADCTATLNARLSVTHRVQIVTEGPRDPTTIEALRKSPSLNRWAAVSEGRQLPMTWLYACPT